MTTLVFGVDPGTRRCGWGVVSVDGPQISHVAHGVIITDETAPLADRLITIDDELGELLEEFAPNAAAVETLFFAKDPQAAAKLGHARGVVLLRLRKANLSIAEYAPTHIKRAIVGRGLADKEQVAQMMKVLMRLKNVPPSDAADALAIAVTHARTLGLRRAMGAATALQKAIAQAKARRLRSLVHEVVHRVLTVASRRYGPPVCAAHGRQCVFAFGGAFSLSRPTTEQHVGR